MPMKIHDVKVAIAFVIQGYLRSNETSAGLPKPEQAALAECMDAISDEVSDWSEGLTDRNAIESDKLRVDINGPRSPYNLTLSIASLAIELCDLSGEDSALTSLAAASGAVAGHAGTQAVIAAEGSFA